MNKMLVSLIMFAAFVPASMVAAQTSTPVDKRTRRFSALQTALLSLERDNSAKCSTDSTNEADINNCFEILPDKVTCRCRPMKPRTGFSGIGALFVGDPDSLIIFTSKDIEGLPFKIMGDIGKDGSPYIVYTRFANGAQTLDELKKNEAIVSPSELNQAIATIALKKASERIKEKIDQIK